MATRPLTHDDYKVGWITALPIERAAAVCMLDKEHPPLPQRGSDENNYALGEIGPHNVVIACLPLGLMGVTSAARVAEQMRSTFSGLRFALMVGIGGGVPSDENDIRLGDVCVSKPTDSSSGVIQYDYGKTLENGRFRFIGSLNRPPDVLLNALSSLQARYTYADSQIPHIIEQSFARHPRRKLTCAHPGADADVLFRAHYGHNGPQDSRCDGCHGEAIVKRPPRTDSNAMVHYGIIASGNQVMRDGVTRERLRKDLNVLCFEMEASGLMDIFPCLVIRGISDYADSHKSTAWQPYAATTAAAYAKELLGVIPPRQVSDTQQAQYLHISPPISPLLGSNPSTPLQETAQLHDLLRKTQQELENLKAKKRRGPRRKGKARASQSIHGTSSPSAQSSSPTSGEVPHTTTRGQPPEPDANTAIPVRFSVNDVSDQQKASFWGVSSPVKTFESATRETIVSNTGAFHSIEQVFQSNKGVDPILMKDVPLGPRRQRSAFARLPPLAIPAREKTNMSLDDELARLLAPPIATARPRKVPIAAKGGDRSVDVESDTTKRSVDDIQRSEQQVPRFIEVEPPFDRRDPNDELSHRNDDVGSCQKNSQPRSPQTPVSGTWSTALAHQRLAQKLPSTRSDTSFTVSLATPPATRPTTPSNAHVASPSSSCSPCEQDAPKLPPRLEDSTTCAQSEDFVGMSAAEEHLAFSTATGKRSVAERDTEDSPATASSEPQSGSASQERQEVSESLPIAAGLEAVTEFADGLEVISPISRQSSSGISSVCNSSSTLVYGSHHRSSHPQDSSPETQWRQPNAPLLGDVTPTPHIHCHELPGSPGLLFAPKLLTPDGLIDSPPATPLSPVATERIMELEQKFRALEARLAATSTNITAITFRDPERDRTFELPWDTGRKWKSTLKLIEQAYDAYPHLVKRIRHRQFELRGPGGVVVALKEWEKTVRPGWEVSIHIDMGCTPSGSPVSPRRWAWRLGMA